MVRCGLIRFGAGPGFRRALHRDVRRRVAAARQAAAGSLSGGNLQKFIVGREILQQPGVLVVAQPTWGVDVGAALAIRQALLDLRDAGAAVLVISEELDELFEIADRIARDRRRPAVAAERRARTNRDEIGIAMTGATLGPRRNDSGRGRACRSGLSARPQPSPSMVGVAADRRRAHRAGRARDVRRAPGIDPLRALVTFMTSAGRGPLWRRRTADQGGAAGADRRRPRGRLPGRTCGTSAPRDSSSLGVIFGGFLALTSAAGRIAGLLPAMVLAGALGGALWAAIPACCAPASTPTRSSSA